MNALLVFRFWLEKYRQNKHSIVLEKEHSAEKSCDVKLEMPTCVHSIAESFGKKQKLMHVCSSKKHFYSPNSVKNY